MSITHNIVSKKEIDKESFLQRYSQIENIKFENRGRKTIYFWIDRKSTRGVDVTFEKDIIEIRNSVLSNKADYDLTNDLTGILLSLSEGYVLNEGGNKVDIPLYNIDRINELEIRDCNLIKTLSLNSVSQEESGDVTIFSPIRKVHFGKNYFLTNSDLNEIQLRDKMFETILKVINQDTN